MTRSMLHAPLVLATSLAALGALASLSACSVASGDDEAQGGTSAYTARTKFKLDAPWSCQLQDMATLKRTAAPSAGRIKLQLSFNGDPAVPAQVAAIVASRPPTQFRKHGNVTGPDATLDVTRSAIDGSGRVLAGTLAMQALQGGVNADEAGDESPYRLRYEISSSAPSRPANDPSAPVFEEDFWITLYNIGNAGKSFTLVANAMIETASGDRLYCTAKTAFADPGTGQMPLGPKPLPPIDDDAGDAGAVPEAAAWPFPTP